MELQERVLSSTLGPEGRGVYYRNGDYPWEWRRVALGFDLSRT